MITGRPGGLTHEETAMAARVPLEDLSSMLRGEHPPTGRLSEMVEMTRRLTLILNAEQVGWWYRTADPELGGASPLELLIEDESSKPLRQIDAVVAGYFNTGYG